MEAQMDVSWNMEDEYEKFVRRMNPPRVVIDNESCKNATVIRVDSANKHGILLEVVQVLADLNLIVTKAYISSDGSWFMDGIMLVFQTFDDMVRSIVFITVISCLLFVEVFNVTDREGRKLRDEKVLDSIRKSLEADSSARRLVGIQSSSEHTSIELTGSDRPGLLSEICAVLGSLSCSVLNAELWTHNMRAAAVMHVTDRATGLAITDPQRLSKVKDLLCNVLKGTNKNRGARSEVSVGHTHTERRLHQMMFADRDYEGRERASSDGNLKPHVTVLDYTDKDYSVVTIRCKDRPKLLFDTVCTLTDMQYVVFHANIDAESPVAYQEYYIRHVDGSPVNSEAEKQRVIQCLEAAIERRVSEGLKLELCTTDRAGLLSDVTRIFRENSLSVTRAEVTTKNGKAHNIFYVSDASGHPVDSKRIDDIRLAIGQTILKVKENTSCSTSPPQESNTRFLFGNLFRSKSLYSFGLVRPYS